MSKIEQYLRHAAECRKMGETMIPAYREKLEQMAQTWEELARMHDQQQKNFNARIGGGLTIDFELPSKRDEPKKMGAAILGNGSPSYAYRKLTGGNQDMETKPAAKL